ncbi:MAG: dihydroneopterin aldolase [Chlorobiaceae bacterium]|nr:dihydroneopterin aldolase [Chlorobiaceae bacterium]NTV61284.1 dihydroneopterin aldolase [Chlorobiaceae bacterium]
MSHQSRSSVRLVNMVFFAYHGVLKEEHTVGAKYEIDAEFSFDFSDAAKNDDITKTVDYGAAYRKIREVFTRKHYSLIESAAGDIAAALLGEFSLLDEVTVRVRKCNPPLGGICDYAEASVSVKQQ